jgi:trypsin-like peptidase/colicin V production protein
MTVADVVILILVALTAFQGYVRGFLVGVMSLVGFLGGAFVGARIGPLILSGGANSPDAPLFALGGALIAGSVLGAIFEGVARRGRRFLWLPGLRLVDGLLGALMAACIGLGLVWIVGAVLLQTAHQFRLPSSLLSSITHSVILKNLNRALPPSGVILNALGHIDPLPSVNARAAAVPAPDVAILRAPGVIAATPAVVQIVGQACGLDIEGSGWVAGPGLVVTNAHVVAGETDTTVRAPGVGSFPARALVFDPHNDIAVLRVPGLSAAPLTLASGPVSGESAAILGYPLNGPFERRAGRLGQTERAPIGDAYGNSTVREVSSLRGLVKPGNSGGPMVDASGQVIGTVFAEITNGPPGQPGGFAVPNSVVAGELALARTRHRTVGTRGCAA